jgi:hypothetical protein
MAESTKPNPESQERKESPEGRETPVMGPAKKRAKVRPIEGEPAIDRKYEHDGERSAPDDPWQDPGGPEPANG